MAIRDLRAGEQAEEEFLVKEKALRDLRSGTGRYLSLVLADETGQEMEGRGWDNAEALGAKCEKGDVVFVRGAVEEYKGKLQLKVVSLERRPEAVGRFVPTLEKTHLQSLEAKLKENIASVGDRHLRALLEQIFGDKETWERFCSSTAAKSLHSAYLGGLLEHTVQVATICETVCGIFPQINRDLLLAAALLHDIGKIDTFELRGAAFEYTAEGNLIGEPVLGEARVSAAIDQLPGFPPDYRLMLRHLLLSHHGQKTFGAPILPMTLEAVTLHHADNLEAKTAQIIGIMKKEQDPAKIWSEYERTLERNIYLPRLESEDREAQ